ncbi:hypothetical protein M2404_000886 [Rheinheimera pacifica]|jgi:hypothetical protein|nr:hypothetical protein [Rheinheimera pacifica]
MYSKSTVAGQDGRIEPPGMGLRRVDVSISAHALRLSL